MFVPPGPDPHLEATVRDDVDIRRYLAEVRRHSVRVRGAHLPETNRVGGRSQRGHQRPRFVTRLLGRDGHGVEVIEYPRRLEP